jgi:hypothetical protein
MKRIMRLRKAARTSQKTHLTNARNTPRYFMGGILGGLAGWRLDRHSAVLRSALQSLVANSKGEF